MDFAPLRAPTTNRYSLSHVCDWYPTGRFFIEFLRTGSWFFLGTPFNVVHLISAVVVISAAIVLVVRHRIKPSDSKVEGDTVGAQQVQAEG